MEECTSSEVPLTLCHDPGAKPFWDGALHDKPSPASFAVAKNGRFRRGPDSGRTKLTACAGIECSHEFYTVRKSDGKRLSLIEEEKNSKLRGRWRSTTAIFTTQVGQASSEAGVGTGSSNGRDL
ncbi:hypothetical protein GWI33_021126 [Rhynchophorus ferrugineus]|uniref:Uncharacterized protein n=1 Tax=Rhynchophorus ferrugineus TaxID=354439 RepID=A0A834M2R4_RHYFE|nr:hypothetical protein GWI33_021126 [Rhynchophorus ferrugineus]